MTGVESSRIQLQNIFEFVQTGVDKDGKTQGHFTGCGFVPEFYESLRRIGHVLDMSVNAPAAALEDPRYAEAAAAIIASSGCPAQSLLFEILESPIGTEHAALLEGRPNHTRLTDLERHLRCQRCGVRGKASLDVDLRPRD